MPLQGVGVYTLIPRALPWAVDWLPFQGARDDIGGQARAESPTSSEQGNALGYVKPGTTPCKGKSKSQPFAHTFALTGRRRSYADTQGVALGCELAALSGRSRRNHKHFSQHIRGPHFASKESYSAGAPITRPRNFVNSLFAAPIIYFIITPVHSQGCPNRLRTPLEFIHILYIVTRATSHTKSSPYCICASLTILRTRPGSSFGQMTNWLPLKATR